MENIDRDSLYYVFLEIQRLHFYRSQKLLDEIGIYHGQPPMLFILNRKNGQSQKELADILNVKPSTITVMLSRMEKAGLVERRQDDEDQRVSRVYITEEGKKACEKAKEVMKKLEEESFGNLSAEEKVILRRLLLQVRNNLQISNEKE